MEKNDEENELGPTGEFNNSQETDEGCDTNNNSDSSSDNSEQGNEFYENLSSESSSTVLVSENGEEEGENLQTGDQDREEIDQDELEREIEKELEEGVEGINKYLEEEAEFINAYQEMVGKERELDQERELEGEESQKTDEVWENEIETAAYTAEQLYESIKEIETNAINEEISEIKEELGIEKEVEQSEEISEPQLSDLKEEVREEEQELEQNYEEREKLEQHQVEPLIKEELENKSEPIVNENEIEKLQELELEEQFQTVHLNEYVEELVEKQNEENEQLKEQEEKEELEAQANDLKEESSELYEELDERNEIEQHQVEPLIKEELETEPESIINEKEIENLQELDIEEQFQAVQYNEYIEELVEKQDEETEQLTEKEDKEELEAQANNIKEETSELYEELEEERDEIEQHQVEPLIKDELETEAEPIVNEKEIEKLQEMDVEEQFQTVHLNEYVDELVEKQEEDKNKENNEIKQEKENIEQTQEVIHQSNYLQEKLEKQEQELELDYEEKDEVEQHQVEAAIEEELKTEPKPIINEEELEYIKVLEPEKQLETELFYEFIEELANKQNEEKEECEENEEQEEISIEQKVAQIMRELDIPQEINTGETEVETNGQEGELEQETTSPDEEVVEQLEIEESKDHQQELEEILEQVRKIEHEALNEIEKEEDLDKIIEKNYERVKRLYKQQTGKRPIYANKETKGFKQWLEQKKKSKEKEKPKQKKEIKEEQKKEETWKWFLKNWIERATEIDSELKSELKKLVEEYDELEKLIKKYSQLYNKAHRELLSQAEKNELKSLIKALQKIDSIKIELFLGIREIKRYLNGQHFFDFWDKPRVNRIRHHFFTLLSQKYKNLKQAQKKKENSEKILRNWIEQASEEEISPELKALLKEIVENYSELEELTIMFMVLYKKEQFEQISQSEKVQLKRLIKTLQKLEPGKIELFANIRAIKKYLNDQDFDDFSDKKRVNQILNRFFTRILFKCESSKSDTYNTKDLIEDLRYEIQILSEELAQIFPDRLIQKRSNAYSHSHLSRLWGMSTGYIMTSVLKKAREHSGYVVREKALLRLQKKIEERLGAKALGCLEIIRRYQSNEINTRQFVDMLEKELGRVSGEIKVTDEELSLILAGTHEFIKSILARIRQPANPDYNPHYKFSKERLSEFKDFLFDIFGSRAKKCFDNLKRYELLFPDLKEYSKQQYTIKKPDYFQNIEENPEKSYWFGFLRADGSRSGDPYKITFTLSEKDGKTLKKFANAIGFPLDRIEPRTRYKLYKGQLKEYQTFRIQFVCRPFAENIDKLGFQSIKAEQKSVPDYVVQALTEAKKTSKIDWWLTLSGQVALAFLLGFYDGDGTYEGGRSAKILSSSKQFLEHIKKLFEIKNNVLTVRALGEDAWAFDRKYVSGGFYSLALGPQLYDMMINSYKDSMQRKRPQNPAESPNFLGDQI